MREVSFTLPDTLWTRADPASLKSDLLRIAGGYTMAMGLGAWQGPKGLEAESVIVYTVAVTGEGKAGEVKLAALKAARNLDQKALYWRDETGEVEIIDVASQFPREVHFDAAL